MAELTSFSIDMDPIGFRSVTVAGQDITDSVSAVDVHTRSGHPTVLTVHHVSGKGRIEGEGIVHVIEKGEVGPEQIAEWLADLDPMALEEEVLNRSGFGDSTFEVALAVLREWAHARS